eukprot:TRINITY_DN11153_c0_g3_i1.p1 TRINITY_DN11153_c0_g3~~TRINITY_DN11153_c0_g3_i1.p1  ORF type:complete len:759 (-),score=77.25 TRINITY_DN11153_c0_g3_i1:193-2469(-)
MSAMGETPAEEVSCTVKLVNTPESPSSTNLGFRAAVAVLMFVIPLLVLRHVDQNTPGGMATTAYTDDEKALAGTNISPPFCKDGVKTFADLTDIPPKRQQELAEAAAGASSLESSPSVGSSTSAKLLQQEIPLFYFDLGGTYCACEKQWNVLDYWKRVFSGLAFNFPHLANAFIYTWFFGDLLLILLSIAFNEFCEELVMAFTTHWGFNKDPVYDLEPRYDSFVRDWVHCALGAFIAHSLNQVLCHQGFLRPREVDWHHFFHVYIPQLPKRVGALVRGGCHGDSRSNSGEEKKNLAESVQHRRLMRNHDFVLLMAVVLVLYSQVFLLYNLDKGIKAFSGNNVFVVVLLVLFFVMAYHVNCWYFLSDDSFWHFVRSRILWQHATRREHHRMQRRLLTQHAVPAIAIILFAASSVYPWMPTIYLIMFFEGFIEAAIVLFDVCLNPRKLGFEPERGARLRRVLGLDFENDFIDEKKAGATPETNGLAASEGSTIGKITASAAAVRSKPPQIQGAETGQSADTVDTEESHKAAATEPRVCPSASSLDSLGAFLQDARVFSRTAESRYYWGGFAAVDVNLMEFLMVYTAEYEKLRGQDQRAAEGNHHPSVPPGNMLPRPVADLQVNSAAAASAAKMLVRLNQTEFRGDRVGKEKAGRYAEVEASQPADPETADAGCDEETLSRRERQADRRRKFPAVSMVLRLLLGLVFLVFASMQPLDYTGTESWTGRRVDVQYARHWCGNNLGPANNVNTCLGVEHALPPS